MIAWLEHDDDGCLSQLRWEPYDWLVQRKDARPRYGVIVCAACDRLFDYGVTQYEASVIIRNMRDGS